MFTISQLNRGKQSIPENSIRLRIIANSNTEIDQAVKMEIRDQVIAHLNTKLQDVDNYESAQTVIYHEVENLNQIVNSVLTEHDIETTYYVDYGLSQFPTKVYDDQLYQAGQYESVYIVLGEGKGDNWWCVLFPPLCLVDINIEDNEVFENGEVEYSFYFLDKLKELFRSK